MENFTLKVLRKSLVSIFWKFIHLLYDEILLKVLLTILLDFQYLLTKV